MLGSLKTVAFISTVAYAGVECVEVQKKGGNMRGFAKKFTQALALSAGINGVEGFHFGTGINCVTNSQGIETCTRTDTPLALFGRNKKDDEDKKIDAKQIIKQIDDYVESLDIPAIPLDPVDVEVLGDDDRIEEIEAKDSTNNEFESKTFMAASKVAQGASKVAQGVKKTADIANTIVTETKEKYDSLDPKTKDKIKDISKKGKDLIEATAEATNDALKLQELAETVTYKASLAIKETYDEKTSENLKKSISVINTELKKLKEYSETEEGQEKIDEAKQALAISIEVLKDISADTIKDLNDPDSELSKNLRIVRDTCDSGMSIVEKIVLPMAQSKINEIIDNNPKLKEITNEAKDLRLKVVTSLASLNEFLKPIVNGGKFFLGDVQRRYEQKQKMLPPSKEIEDIN